MPTPKQIIRDWIEAYNHRDADALAACYRQEAGLALIHHGGGARGREAVARLLIDRFATPFGPLQAEVCVAEGAWLALEWSVSAGLKGCDMLHIQTGKIHFHRRFCDSRVLQDLERRAAIPVAGETG
jgi:ketosteroid isomerase-like protein